MAINLETFSKALIYKADLSFQDILKDFSLLAEIDQQAEQKVAYFQSLLNWCWGGIILAVVGLIVGSIQETGSLIGFSIFLLLLLLVPTIFCSTKKSYYKRLDLSNLRQNLPQEILSLIDRDRNPQRPLKIQVVFTPPTQEQKKTQTLPHPYKPKFKIDCFVDQWLTLEGEFLDRTEFALAIAELTRTAYGWTRSRSGKSKYKTKSKPKGTGIDLTLKFPAKKYSNLQTLQAEASQAIKLPQWGEMKQLKVTNQALHLKVKLLPNSSQEQLYQTVAAMLLSLYQILNFAKKISKKKVA